MSRVLAVAVATVLARHVLLGSAIDLGEQALPLAAAVLLVALGAGIAQRARVPYLSDGVALALLVPLRGPLSDLAHALLPAAAAPSGAALASLAPLGFVLGRQLAPSVTGPAVPAFLGVCLGEALVRLGAAGALPSWSAGAATAAALAALAEARSGRRASFLVDEPSWPALPIGFALAAIVLLLRRVVPGYVEPTAQPAGDTLVVLLLLASAVAWPASRLARDERLTRPQAAVGALLLAAAALATLGSLGLHHNAIEHVVRARRLHVAATRYAPLADEWLLWLGSFASLGAAAFGLVAGSLRGRFFGPLVAGAGCAVLVEQVLLWRDPAAVPELLARAAAGAALAAAPLALLGARGAILAPVATLPFLLAAPERVVFDEVRRPGEYLVESFESGAVADVVLVSTPPRDAFAPEGRRAWRSTFTCTEPVFRIDARGALVGPPALGAREAMGDHAESGVGHDARAERDAGDAVAGTADGSRDEGEGARSKDATGRHCFALRVGGVAIHAGHAPIGPQGTLGRFTRWLARPGRIACVGTGAELVAADLHDAGLSSELVVASSSPFGHRATLLLLRELGSAGWQAREVHAPMRLLREELGRAFDSVVLLVGARDEGALAALETFERASALLGEGGRCLAWLDGGALDAGALAARVAAFGRAFEGRAAAFLEPREAEAPLVLLLGWRDDAGRPEREALQARLPPLDPDARRAPLRSVEDLGALLLADGASLVALAEEGALHRRRRPIVASALSAKGWAGVRGCLERLRELAEAPRLSSVVAGVRDAMALSATAVDALAEHAAYDYRPDDLNDTLLGIEPDVDWEAFDAAGARLAVSARAAPGDPLVQLSLAALLEPLAAAGDFGRFATIYESSGARQIPSHRLALMEAWVQQASLETEAAAEALARARTLRP